METRKTTEKVEFATKTMTTTIRQEMDGCYAVVKILPQIILLICLIIFCFWGGCLLKPVATTTCNCKDAVTIEVRKQLEKNEEFIAKIKELEKRIENLSQQKEELKSLTHAVENLTKSRYCRCCWKRKWDVLAYLKFPLVKKCCYCD